jgi:hypothetical protein
MEIFDLNYQRNKKATSTTRVPRGAIMTTKTTRRKVTRLEKRFACPVEFMLDHPPYCSESRDLIACVCYPEDICREVETLRSAGYTEDEIHWIYDYLRENGSMTLDRPIYVTLTVKIL